MDLYRTTVFFNGSRSELVVLLTGNAANIVREAVVTKQVAYDVEGHGFIHGEPNGIFYAVNGENVDYMTAVKFVPPKY